MRIVFANTVPVGLAVHARGQLRWLSSEGHEVMAVTAHGLGLEELERREQVAVRIIPMQRDISPARDLRALGAWIRLLLRVRPDVIVYGSPKASLLGSVSGALASVQRRIYIAHGARFEGAVGLKRSILRWADRITCALSSEVIAVSPSVERAFLDASIVRRGRIRTVGYGSCNGVDLVRFAPMTPLARSQQRALAGIASGEAVVGFVGRLTRDKGLDQLVESLRLVVGLLPEGRSLTLLVAGWEEETTADEVRRGLPQVTVRYLGFVREIEKIYPLCDVMLLPTRREGLPSSVLEAAACGVPTIANAVTGTVDAILDGQTGYLVMDGSAPEMAERTLELLSNPVKCERLGSAARRFVESRFSQERVWPALLDVYVGSASVKSEG